MAQRKITKQTRLAVLVSTPNLRALRYYRAALPTSSTPRARIPSATMASAGCRMYKQQKRSPWSSGNCCVGPDIVSIIMIDKLQASPAMVADCNTSANIIFNNKSTGMSLASFDILEKLGQGSFAKVYKVRRHSDQKIYALKQVYLNKLDQKSKLNALNQIRLLASFDCGAIVKYYEAFIDDREGLLCIVMEYADEGDLKALIEAKRHKGEKFYQMQIWKVLVSLVKGLVYLHARSIIHRDIKPDNILSADGQFKIGDLNVSCVQQNSLQKLTQIGTPFYASPEIWSNQPYDHKCDIWSLGCVIYQMATLSLPFPSTSMDKLFIEVTKAKPKPIPKHYSNELCHIIDICLQKSRDKRPSAQELLDNFTVKMYDNLFYCGEQKKAQDYARLLKTIKFPTNKNINEIELPAANYEAPPQPKTGREINIEEDLTKVEPGSQHFMMDLFSNQTPKNTQDLPGNFEQESRQQKKNGIIPTAEKIKGAHSILTINPEVGQELNVKESLRIEKRSIHKSHILIPVTIMKEANPYPKASSQKEIQSELPVRHNNGGVTLKSIDQKRCLDTKQNSQHASLNKRANQTEQKSRTRKSSPRTQLSAKKLQTVACAYEGILMKKLKEGGRRMSACQNLGQNWVLTEGNDFRHKIQEKLQKRHSMKQQGSKKQLQKRSVNIIAEVSNQTRPRTQQSSILNEARQSKANKQRKNRGKLFETELEACISNTDLMKRIKNLHKAIVF